MGNGEELKKQEDGFVSFDSRMEFRTVEESMRLLSEEYDEYIAHVVKSVTNLLRTYRRLEREFFTLFGHQKKVERVYDEAKKLKNEMDRSTKKFEEDSQDIDRNFGVKAGEEYFKSDIYPMMTYARESIKDLALRSEMLHSKSEEPPEEFTCAVCMDLLYHPVDLICGHRFCQHCLKLATKSTSKCPLCRREGMTKHCREDVELNSFLRKRYPELYRGRQADRFERQQQEYERVLRIYERSVRQAHAARESAIAAAAASAPEVR